MRNRHAFIAIALLALLTGCNRDEPANASNNGKGTPPPVGVQEKQDGVLENLKNDAYYYSGLGQQQKLTYKGKLNPNVPEGLGVQSVTWTKNENGSSMFEFKRSGILIDLGRETVRLDENGAYITGISSGTMQDEAFKIPSSFKVGTEWETEFTIRRVGEVLTTTMSSKVVREETITVDAGTFECMVVKATTTLTTDKAGSGKSTLSSISYHARGIGEVKLEAKGKNADGEEIDFYLELVKIGD